MSLTLATQADQSAVRPVKYAPQPGPQYALTQCPYDEIFYGGARGGGKTFGFLLDWAIWSDRWGADYQGVIFRRTYDELDEVITLARKILCGGLGAVWRAGKRTITMRNGAMLKFRYLKRDDDADNYQGHQYTWIAFDEVTNWATPTAINKLRACLRGLPPEALRLVLSGNPGGPGHNWVKARFVDPAPPYTPIIEERLNPMTGEMDRNTRIFIPSLYEDNPALSQNDPGYLTRLQDSGPEWLVKAWVGGDWNIVAGGMFDDVLNVTTPHEYIDPNTGAVLEWGRGSRLDPFVIPAGWRVDRSFDWGSTRPFSVGWWAESDGTPAVAPSGALIHLPAKSLVRIHTWYGWNGKPNEGCGMLSRDVARGIVEIEAQLLQGMCRQHQAIRPGPADTSIWSGEDGVCIADKMRAEGVRWEEADKRPGSRVAGWETMRQMFVAASKAIPEEPGLYAFATDAQFWRMVPTAPRDAKYPDDINTASEDHLLDETRYRCQRVAKELRAVRVKGL